MKKGASAQVGIPEKLAKLKRWRDLPEWTTRAAAKDLGVPRGTLLGCWKKELWTKLDDAGFAETFEGRIRVKTCKSQRKLTSYELQILEYHDSCLREDGKVVYGDLVKYGRTIPEFLIRNDGTQLSWISRFMVRESSDRPIPSDRDDSGECVGDSVENKREKAPPEEKKASKDECKELPGTTALANEQKALLEETTAATSDNMPLEEKGQQKGPPHRESQRPNPRKKLSLESTMGTRKHLSEKSVPNHPAET